MGLDLHIIENLGGVGAFKREILYILCAKPDLDICWLGGGDLIGHWGSGVRVSIQGGKDTFYIEGFLSATNFPSLQREQRYNPHMHIDIDILVYVLIAAVLLGRLWAVLGTRSEDEPQRPNPFVTPPPAAETKKAAPIAPVRFSLAPPPASLDGGLAQVKAVDASFEEKAFLQEARAAFTAIVTGYAAGTMDTLTPYLSPALLAHFSQAAEARRAEGQTAQSRIIRIKEAEVASAHSEDSKAFITVRFTSDQENILRDSHGTIIGGVEGKIEEVTDIWVFTRNTKTPASKWVVVETRG